MRKLYKRHRKPRYICFPCAKVQHFIHDFKDAEKVTRCFWCQETEPCRLSSLRRLRKVVTYV